MQLRVNGDQSQLHSLSKPTYLIGRSAACNIRVTDESVQPVHACLKVDNGSVRIVQQDGAPVQVNGDPLKNEAVLNHGDTLTLGDTTFTIVDPNMAMDSDASGQSDQHTLVRSANGGAKWALHGLSRALDGKKFDITLAAVVGRARDCDIRLGEAHLSRRHARLTVTDEGLLVEDLDSANGTYVNGRRIRQATLRSGDEVSFDTLKFRTRQLDLPQEGDETRIRPALQEPLPAANEAYEEGRQDTPAEVPPVPPMGPTAIERQHAALRRLREDRGLGTTSFPSEKRNIRGGWLAVAVIALVGVLWGATSFLQVAPKP